MHGVFCFRNDLRLVDNQGLQMAVDTCDTLHLTYAFEDRLWKTPAPKRISVHRARFILESLQCLAEQIRISGGKLKIIYGLLVLENNAWIWRHSISCDRIYKVYN